MQAEKRSSPSPGRSKPRASKRLFILAATGFALWHSRALQFVTFLAAAGVRKLITDTAAPDLEPLVHQWEAMAPPASIRARATSRCAITLHHWYLAFKPAEVNACLAEIAAVGAGYLRADIRWKDLFPGGTQLNFHAVSWYRHYLRAARDWHGLKPIVVLSNPPQSIDKLTSKEKIEAWHNYIDTVVTNFSDLCQSYQLMNELNNPVFRFLPSEDAATAVGSAAARIRARLPNAQLMINVLANLWGWKSDLQQYITDLGSAIDIFGIDSYPETWAVGLGDAWKEFERSIIELRLANKHARLAVLETGYSTNIPYLRDERRQTAFYRRLETALIEIDRIGPLPLIAFYEICDENSSTFLDPEAHFGLLKSKPFRRKACFAQVQRMCQMFKES